MTQTATAPPTLNGSANQPKKELTIVDSTLARVSEMQANGEMKLPKDYSAGNALKAAWLLLQDIKDTNKTPVLQSCTKESIAYALLNMVLQGLNPMKKQCSFLAYGNKLVCQREYQGSIALAKRYGLKSVVANPVFEGDDFHFEVEPETGRRKITKHVPTFDSWGGKVKGAYAIVEMEDGSKNTEIMTMNQIQSAWNQGPTKGQSPAHKNFPDQMACKTVINRAMKGIINSSDDSALFEEDEQVIDQVQASVKHEIDEHANKTTLSLDNQPQEPVYQNESGEDMNGSAEAASQTSYQEQDQPNQPTLGPGF